MSNVKLSPNRRTMLRLVAFSEVTLLRGGDLEPRYHERELGLLDGHGANALQWLEQNGFVRCVGEKGLYGLRTGPMRPTAKGSEWLADNKLTA